jgi:hypothetical protein
LPGQLAGDQMGLGDEKVTGLVQTNHQNQIPKV